MVDKINPFEIPKDPFIGAEPKSESQLQCEADGGKWDSSNNKCIMPTKEPEPQQKIEA